MRARGLTRSALAYAPGSSPLHGADPRAAIVFLASFAVVAFAYSSPLVLAACGIALWIAGRAAGASRALVATLRWGAVLFLFMVAVNAIVTSRGATVLVRGFDAPVLGRVDVTLESMTQGGVIGLRILVVMLAFAVYSACVDPDSVLRMLRPVARRSALTATLVSRMVPVAAGDLGRLREASLLRGPAAAPAGRGAMARRLVAGSLDRAVDLAATIELRGYGLEAKAGPPRRKRSLADRRLLACGVAIAIGSLMARAAGVGDFETYPRIELDAAPATVALCAALPIAAIVPFLGRRR
jgi:energy-coupling factor transport system permease protein